MKIPFVVNLAPCSHIQLIGGDIAAIGPISI